MDVHPKTVSAFRIFCRPLRYWGEYTGHFSIFTSRSLGDRERTARSPNSGLGEQALHREVTRNTLCVSEALSPGPGTELASTHDVVI